ncbi:E3 ubiquitin-protein ligase RNF123-like isoform X2 [Mytilus trossulus]|uniref:E3 ubiquitin-protein ligase RNF123-like isoform X2 n=1 Tax=Mytilus trossulus TaxID=6551 RepID=UPI003006E9CE
MAEAAYKGGIYVRSEQDQDTGSEDPYLKEILDVVFHHKEEGATAAVYETSKPTGLMNLQYFLGSVMESPKSEIKVKKGNKENTSGRIGPSEVVFDFRSNGGSGIVAVESHRLEVTSCSNFSTIRANCCVFKGKWVYEVMLGSEGMMQIGWCTINCKFFHEEGVGDTVDSYAFDGNRVRKWNKTTQRYGEAWTTGDIISCAIDCDEGTVTFYRNGKNMGKAFTNINLGPGYAYFPAVSLAASENLRANFGATPHTYPIEGYRPLQDPPTDEIAKAWYLLDYLENLLPYVNSGDQFPDDSLLKTDDTSLGHHPSKSCTTLLVAAHLFDQLAPLLKNAYIVEQCLIKFLLRINSYDKEEQSLICNMFDLMWSLMQDFEIKGCMESLSVSLLSLYRFSPALPDFKYHKDYLNLLLSILHHQQTRRYLLSNVLFDKIKFAMFMHIKSPDDKQLSEFVPVIWFDLEKDVDKSIKEENDKNKQKYLKSCDQLQNSVQDVEKIQVEVLKKLMIHTDVVEQKTTRIIFMEKCRKFFKENSGLGRIQHGSLCPSSVILCMFHRLIQAVRFCWDKFQEEDPCRFVTSSDAYIPIHQFWSETIDYFEFQRCGGLISHVNRMLGSEVNKAQGLSAAGSEQTLSLMSSVVSKRSDDYPPLEMPSGNSLMELLDGLVMMYHIAAHKQLGKRCNLRDNMKEFVESLQDTQEKINKCPPDEDAGIREELNRAYKVFLSKIEEQSRKMAWVTAVTYSKTKRSDIEWLLKVVLQTIKRAAGYKLLFQYVPEYYILTAINAFNALFNFFHPTVPFESLDNYNETLHNYALFITRHFSDHRILNPDVREEVVQALACFICYPESLKVLESLPEEKTKEMIEALITPHENRSLSQTNWILVRIWKGCGFRFRFTHLPHLVPSKVQTAQFGFASLQKPLPSYVFQELIRKLLLQDGERSTKFLDMILNQLNWSFSEFIGLMQEIQQKVTSPELVILESRQLKICATCFEIAVCLMRIIEMIVTKVPEVFLDPALSSSELLLKRLIQVLCQILNRITARNGIFEGVVSLFIQGLPNVSYFPIAGAMIGILIQLVIKSSSESKQSVLRYLISDPGFKVQSLEYLVGKLSSDTKNDQDILLEEKTDVEELTQYLKLNENTEFTQHHVKEDDLCTICYSDQMSVMFVPCGHQSCRNCISHQMMSKKECFFCKTAITDVTDLTGASILTKSGKSGKLGGSGKS